MTLTPAYGRDYKSAAAVKADFAAGKDFLGRTAVLAAVTPARLSNDRTIERLAAFSCGARLADSHESGPRENR